MQELPQVKDVLRLLHDTVDKTCDAKRERLLKEIENERREKHAEVEAFFSSLLDLAGVTTPPPPTETAPQQAPAPPPDFTLSPATPNGDQPSARKLFPLQGTMLDYIEMLPNGAEIDQRSIYSLLVERYPELRGRDEVSFRSQIIGLLNKFATQGKIRLVKKGMGGNPNIYQKIYRPTVTGKDILEAGGVKDEAAVAPATSPPSTEKGGAI